MSGLPLRSQRVLAFVALAAAWCGPATTGFALPATTVIWENRVAGTTPPSSALMDADGDTPLNPGGTGNGDGAVLVLGYFTGATGSANFNGVWVPLTGPRSPHLPFAATSIGDGTAGVPGYFALSTAFNQAAPGTFQNIPAVGTRLAVAVFNRSTFATSTHCNIATNDTWQWQAPQNFPVTVAINLHDSGTVWFGGSSAALRTAVAVSSFPGYPVITGAPAANLGLNAGEPLALSPAVSGAATLELQWFKNDAPLTGETGAALDLGTSTPPDAGTYFLRAANAAGVAETRAIGIAVHTQPARLLNLSTRGFVGTGDALLIPGFAATGTGQKTVLIRAIGPTLGTSPFDVPGVLGNPQLSVRNGANEILTGNDDWRSQPNSAAVAAAILATGAFPLPDGSQDAALLFDAPVGNALSVHVSGVSGATGIVIAEVYVLDDLTSPNARLVNLSTRGFVGTGSNVMIPGFFLSSGGTRQLLIRAVGPTLGAPPFGLSGVVPNPVVRVRRAATQEEVATNDNWQDGGQGPAIAAAATQVLAFALQEGSADAALILRIPPAAPDTSDRGFTIEVFDANGATGLAIAEIYELP